MIYGKRTSGGEHGSVHTKIEVVKYILDSVNYCPNKDLSSIKVLDPACGHGEFILEAVHRLYQSSIKFQFDFTQSLSNIKAVEINDEKSKIIKNKLHQYLLSNAIHVSKGIIDQSIISQDYLLLGDELYDIIIGNPPYVRHENIPDEKKAIYRIKYETFQNRCDIYVLFFEKALKSLKPNGVVCYICANRWIKNQFGKRLRALISKEYCLEQIVDMENVDAFEEKVLAYASIFKIKNSIKSLPFKYCHIDKVEDLNNVSRSMRKHIFTDDDWIISDSLQDMDESKLYKIEDLGFKIGIGVATGADKIFISKEFNSILEKEAILPILQNKDVKTGVIKWSGEYLLNPFDENGKLINLDEYPRAKQYLHSHSDALQLRHVAKKNPLNWYKTIDKVKKSLLDRPKLLLPDLGSNKKFTIDSGKFYPHHNLYYIVGKSVNELKALAATLMSTFIDMQINEISIKMAGGRVRWQSQNIRKLLIPDLNSLSKKIKNQLISAYEVKNTSKIDLILKELLSAEIDIQAV